MTQKAILQYQNESRTQKQITLTTVKKYYNTNYKRYNTKTNPTTVKQIMKHTTVKQILCITVIK